MSEKVQKTANEADTRQEVRQRKANQTKKQNRVSAKSGPIQAKQSPVPRKHAMKPPIQAKQRPIPAKHQPVQRKLATNDQENTQTKGQGWDYTKDAQGNVHVTAKVNFGFDLDEKLLPEGTTVDDYKKAISAQFNDTLKLSSSGKFSGQITFNDQEEKSDTQVIPSLNISANKPDPKAEIVIAGMTSYQFASVNIYKKDGSIVSPKELALDAVHELLHTLRFDHPFERTQGADTKLIHDGGDNYLSTPTTDPNILYNIMNYSLIDIDGKNAGDKPLNLMTQDQLKMLLSEIDLQKQGYGLQSYDKNLSQKENEARYMERYQDYWFNPPGQEVPKKKK